MIDPSKKATVATVKSFVRKNRQNLLVETTSTFDGMVDGVRQCEDRGFSPAVPAGHVEHTMGVQGAWLVGGSRDYIKSFCEDGFEGYEVYNSCGNFRVAVKS